MFATRWVHQAAGLLVVGFLAAGCGEARSTMDEVARIIQRETARRNDVRSVRADPILEYAFAGDSATVRRMLEASPDSAARHVRARDPVGMTALHKAVWAGNAAIVRMLLDHGADVNAVDGGGQSPISLAARWGHGDLVELLIARGADASGTDDQGRTLLHYAAQHGHIAVMRGLLARGFDVNVMAKPGTPLHSAVFGQQLEATRFLLDHGGDVKLRGSLAWTPLHVACGTSQRGLSDPAIARLLMDRGADPMSRAHDGMRPLVLAALAGDSTMAALLISRGARPEAAPPRGYSELRSAIEGGWFGVTEMLLAQGADPNERYAPPGTERLLHRVAGMRRPALARLLLSAGADPNLPNDQGRTSLHVATYQREPGMTRMLLGWHARVDARDESGWTPLHVAAAQKNVEVVEALLVAGADPRARTKGGETPTQLAWGADGEPVRRLLAKAMTRR